MFYALPKENEAMLNILKRLEHERIAEKAAQWFHQKWGVPTETNIECMKECLRVYMEEEYRCRAVSIPRSVRTATDRG